MAQPALWPKKTFFYPIGNTPATHLTANLPPETPADVLLLGCGDVRNVLFTIFMESGSLVHRKLDVTCNDHEPAILTRNLLLYTLLLDESLDLDILWNIYYHFYLDAASLKLLYSQCRKVLELTGDLEDWDKHKYGRFLRFASDSTLDAIRHHLNLYLELETLSGKAKKDLRSAFSDGMQKLRTTNGGSVGKGYGWASAGPLFALDKDLCLSHYRHYRQTGLSAGTPKSGPTLINPTFAYSRAGRGFNVHAGSDPVVTFHLAPAFAPVESSSMVGPVKTIEQLADVARTQFRAWCKAFQRRTEATSSLHIRFLVGDVMHVCKALRRYQADNALKTGIYVSPWGGSKVNFYPSDYDVNKPGNRAPPTFNVIDTSNLSDHLGIVNILIATVPLLRRSPASLLSTHMLLKGPGETHLNSLHDLGHDVAFLSLVMGVTPSRCLTNISTTGTVHEAFLLNRLDKITGSRFHDPITWRFLSHEKASTRSHLECDPDALADALLVIYKKLFESENMAIRGLGTMGRSVIYDRTSFCELLSQVRRSFSTVKWENFMDRLDTLISMDTTLMMTAGNYQDLMCQLFLRGLYTVDILKGKITGQPSSSPLYSNKWPNGEVPPVVCVTLVVPRAKLRVVESIDPDTIMTPNITCDTRGPGWHNVHSSIRPIFGSIKRTPNVIQSVEIIEDPAGWSGSSSLIVSFYMPSWVLKVVRPGATRIALSFDHSAGPTRVLMSKLGMFLEIFGTVLDDEEHVFLTPVRPDNPQDLDTIRKLAEGPSEEKDTGSDDDPGSSTSTKLTFVKDRGGNSALKAITVRATIVGADKKDVLSNKDNAVDRVDEGNYSLVLRYGSFTQLFPFPFPVNLAVVKIRVARKSSFIEVEAPVQEDPELSGDGFPNPFSVLNRDDGPPLPLHMHYTPLDQLPILRYTPSFSMSWVKEYNTVCMFSIVEAKEKSNSPLSPKRKHSMKDLKDTIMALFDTVIEKKGKPFVVGLHNNSMGGGVTSFLFINKLRFDLHGYSLVLDACVLDLHQEMMKDDQATAAVKRLERAGGVTLSIPDDEMVLWKMMIPACVERCRTWSHNPNCTYLATSIPVSVGLLDSPICNCGRGKDLGPFHETASWNGLAPFVVRMAIGLIFPSNFDAIAVIDNVENQMKEAHTSGRASANAPRPSPKSSKPAGSSKPGSSTQDACWNCQGKGKGTTGLLTCSRCKSAKYCSLACQKKDWKTHKISCSN